jgi:DNA replication licensing factor MCM3
LAQSYLKKYLNHIKQTVTPDLSDNAVELIASLWTLLRQKDANDREQSYTKVLPVTIRTQESLIRLATAHAKILQSA